VPPFCCAPHTDFFPLAYDPYLLKLGRGMMVRAGPPTDRFFFFQPCDLLDGCVMQDPDTGDEFTGHDWVERYSGEFAQALQKGSLTLP
jgi:hypothetical protein